VPAWAQLRPARQTARLVSLLLLLLLHPLSTELLLRSMAAVCLLQVPRAMSYGPSAEHVP